ncbi:LacI family DNA-binding transcriptional regulator [Kineococcus rubinsiae]|uniref:LacI family DNA-binding transcriptional regulator n=1 Tax=Kineococcus rubinsiae TaxID=2609562 RepID=UPI0014320BD4|nr:LacI family DNA-binding transcriptional regulator [Kineococcus rubinsiae]
MSPGRAVPPPRPATIKDVAAASGVSRQTVTRAVNAMPGINADTRERVLAAARELGYRPSRFGRGLVKPPTRTLGLLVEDLTNPYYPELASAVLRLAAQAGWNVVLAERAAAPAGGDFLTERFGADVDAVVSFTGLHVPARTDGLAELPIVEIAPGPHETAHGRVDLDLSTAIVEAVAHLHERGVRRPVVLDLPGGSGRAAAFVAAFAARDTTAMRVPTVSTDLAGGLETAGRVLTEVPDVDALVAFNDVTGFGVLRALRLAGVDVPGQVRVLGVDGLAIGSFVTPRLTTLALDMPLVARTALEVVLALHAGTLAPGDPGTRRRVPYRLDVGEST